MKKNILVVAVHPDDETLGCGGTILKHKKNGDRVFWCIVTGMKEELGYSTTAMKQRADEIRRAGDLYGFEDIINIGLPTTAVEKTPLGDRVRIFSGIFKKIRPETVYLPFSGDVHSDHRAVFESSYGCIKTFRYPFCRQVLMMETPSETEFAAYPANSVFIPNYFNDISPFMAKKLKIMSVYKSELNPHPFPRSIENVKALALLRGAAANCNYAEAFMILKMIER